MPAYGKKSEPPRKAIKEMKSKQAEHSSKDALHRGVRHPPGTDKRTK